MTRLNRPGDFEKSQTSESSAELVVQEEEAPRRKQKKKRGIERVVGTPVGSGNLLFDVTKFWVAQVQTPDARFENWNKELKLVHGDANVYGAFTDFVHECAGTNVTMCSNRDFFELSRFLVDGFKKRQNTIIIPPRAEVEQCLRRMNHNVQCATQEIRRPFKLFKQAYGEQSSFHMLVTPDMRRDTDAEHSWISYYNITAHGQDGKVTMDTPRTSTRLKDMGTIHPLWEDSNWRHFLHLVAGLSLVKSLFIYVRFDAGNRYQYVVVHEQAFQLKQPMEEDSNDLVNRFTVNMTVDGEVEDEGLHPVWMCDLDRPNVGELELPEFQGLRVRLMFRQDYSKWFL